MSQLSVERESQLKNFKNHLNRSENKGDFKSNGYPIRFTLRRYKENIYSSVKYLNPPMPRLTY